MEIKNNTLRLTEAELHQLIENAARQAINEGRFGNMAKKVGKGIGKAALAAGLGAATLYAADRGLENEYQHNQQMHRQAAEMSRDPQAEYIKHQGKDPKTATPQDWENAELNTANESKLKISDKMLESIVRAELKKILG